MTSGVVIRVARTVTPAWLLAMTSGATGMGRPSVINATGSSEPRTMDGLDSATAVASASVAGTPEIRKHVINGTLDVEGGRRLRQRLANTHRLVAPARRDRGGAGRLAPGRCAPLPGRGTVEGDVCEGEHLVAVRAS